MPLRRPRLQRTDRGQARSKPARQYLSCVMHQRFCRRCLCRRPPCCLGQGLDQDGNDGGNLAELNGSGRHAHAVAPVTEYDQLPGGMPRHAQVPTTVALIGYLEPRTFPTHVCSMYPRNGLVDGPAHHSARDFSRRPRARRGSPASEFPCAASARATRTVRYPRNNRSRGARNTCAARGSTPRNRA